MNRMKFGLLSVVTASLLVGCGGGSSSSSDNETTDQEESSSVVCIDTNDNATCDAGETSENVASWSDYAGSTARSLDNTNYPLAYNGTDGLILTAAAGSDEINPWTTLVHSEIKNNPVVENATDAETYLLDTLNLTEVPTTDELTSLANDILTQIKANETTNISSLLAAISAKVISTKSLSADISISSDDISDLGLTKLETKELFSVNVDAEVEAQEADGWTDAHDASMIHISSKNGHIVTGSKYHNALSVVDVNAKTITYNPFATVKGAGHGVLDADSGASENYMSGVSITADGSIVYANVPPKKTSSTTYDTATVGLYKATIGNDGAIDATATSTVRIDDKFSSFQVSNDDSTIVAYNSENYLITYDKDLTEQKAEEIENIEAFAISTDNATIYTAFKDSDSTDMPNYISKITATDLTIGTDKIALDFTPDEIIVLSGTKLLAINKDDLAIAIVDLTTNKVTSSVTMDMESNYVSVSPNGKYLAVAGHDDKKVLIINLEDDSLPLQHTIELESTSKVVSFVSDEQIAYLNDSNSVTLASIEDTGVVITLEEKFDSALKDLKESINGGYYDAIISDINLVSLKNGFDISWESTATALTNDGSVTRPENDATNNTGNLTVTVQSEYRDKNVSKSATVAVEIRKKPMMLDAPKVTSSGRMEYMAVNADGSVMVAPEQFTVGTGDDEKSIYGISSYTLDSSNTPLLKTSAKIYHDNEQVIGVGFKDSFAIAVSASTIDDTYSGRISTISLDNGLLGENETNTIEITSGSPQKVEYNSDSSKVGVMIKKEDGSFIAEIYDVTSEGTIALNSTIDMGDKEYKTYGPLGISEDGTKVFQRDGDAVHVSTISGIIASKNVDNLARVWAGANRVFVMTYAGLIYSYDENLENEKVFSTGTGGRMYGGEVRVIDNKNYLFIPVQRSSDELNGIYQLEINSDGSLEEIAFSNQAEGADRMAVSQDGSTIFFSFEDDNDDRKVAAVQLTVPTIEAFTASYALTDGMTQQTEANGWKGAQESEIKYLSVKNGHVVAGSTYHNALSVVDTSAKTINYNSFAILKGSEKNVVDADSGASEVKVKDIAVTGDGKSVYTRLPSKTTNAKSDTIGIFKTMIATDGTIADYDDASTKKASGEFKSFALANNDALVVAYTAESELVSYTSDLTETAAKEIDGITAYTIASNNTDIYTAFDINDQHYISTISLDATTFTVGTDQTSIDFEAEKLIMLSDTTLLAIGEDKVALSIVDLSTNTVTLNKVLGSTEGEEAASFSVSPNKKYLVVAAELPKVEEVGIDEKHRGKIYIVNLETLEATYTSDTIIGEVQAISFIDDSTYIYGDSKTSVKTVKINEDGTLVN